MAELGDKLSCLPVCLSLASGWKEDMHGTGGVRRRCLDAGGCGSGGCRVKGCCGWREGGKEREDLGGLGRKSGATPLHRELCLDLLFCLFPV